MTQPVPVGQVSVEVIASAKALAKSLKKEVESAFKDLDIKSAIRDAIGNTKIKLPVELDPDTAGIGEKVRRTRVPKVPVDLDPNTDSIPEKVRRTKAPKVPVEIDPLMAAFQQEIRRQTSALARTVNAKIPVGADTGGLRAELGASLAAVQHQLKVQIPTEPAGRADYALKLRALVDEASAKVKAKIKVEPDGKSALTAGGSNVLGGIGRGFANVGNAIPNIPGLNLLGGALKGIGGITSGISGFIGKIGELGSGVEKVAGESAQLGGSLAGAFESASGPVGLVIGLLGAAGVAMAALGGAAALAAPLISAVAGAAAAIPAALAGAGAVFGTLALGFKGISEAFKPKTGGGGGGGSVVNQARQIAAASRGVESARRGIAAANRNLDAAERGLASAELNVVQAQERSRLASDALGKARKEARGDIEDLSRALRGAQLAEEDAALGVTDALRALNDAKLTGNIPDIQRADLAYREAQLTLENAKDSSHDLGDAQVDAAKKGVEGSDKVQAALRGQADAAQAVKDAQNGIVDAQNAVLSANDGLKSSYDGLASAQDSLAQAQQKVASGGAAAAAKIIKLAPAAQRFVDAIKALKPAFEGLRLDVQQRLFQGLDQTVTHLGDAWIPALKVTLGRYADTFNGFFRSLGAAITTPKFIKDLQAGAEGARQGFSAIGSSITTSLVPAFGALSRAAGPFLTQLGREIADIVTDFSNWVLQGEKSGGLKSFFATASTALHDIFTTGKLVVGIVGNILKAIVGPGAGSGKTPIDALNEGLAHLNGWLSKPETQQKIHTFITDVGSLVGTLADFGKQVGAITGWLDRVFPPDGQAKAEGHGSGIGHAIVAGLIAGIGEGMKLSLELFIQTTFIGGVIDLIKAGFGIKSPSTVMAEIGRDLVAGLINGIGSLFGALASRVSGLRTTITNQLSDAGSLLVNAGRNVVAGLANGITSLYGTLSQRAGLARTYITNALSNAGTLLYNAGRAVVIGLANGIGSLGTWLWNKAVALATTVRDAAKSALGIASPSKVMAGLGREVPAGLAVGILAGRDRVASAMADLSGVVGATTLPGFGADADLAVSRSLQVASQQHLEAYWAPGATADPVMAGIQRFIKFRHGGDVQAALGSG